MGSSSQLPELQGTKPCGQALKRWRHDSPACPPPTYAPPPPLQAKATVEGEACEGAPIRGLQLPSEENTRVRERGNAARDRWRRRYWDTWGERQGSPSILGDESGSRGAGTTRLPQSHFHLTIATSMSCLVGQFWGLVRTKLTSIPFPCLPSHGCCILKARGSTAGPSVGYQLLHPLGNLVHPAPIAPPALPLTPTQLLPWLFLWGNTKG